jgi:ferredoxin
VRLERIDGVLNRLVAQRMQLQEPDASGRRRPVAIAGSEFVLPVDTVIAAVSQAPDLSGLGDMAEGAAWLSTDASGLLAERIGAGGDVLGLGIAGFAIAQGRRAAEALHARLSGEPQALPAASQNGKVGLDRINVDFHARRPAARVSRLCPTGRLLDPGQEVSRGLSEADFLAEVERCFSCGSCFGCQLCNMYCTVGGFVRRTDARPGAYYALSLDECEECGKCIEVCPCGFLDASAK